MKRIQRKRTKGFKMPTDAVYVGRPTKWGNPYKVGKMFIPEDEIFLNPFNPKWEMCKDIKQALSLYENFLKREIQNKRLDLSELKGKKLACWCNLNLPCHVDIIEKFLNQ